MMRFDEDGLRRRIAGLPPPARGVFAAAVATRQVSVIARDDFLDVFDALDALWDHLTGQRQTEDRLRQLAAAVEERVPDSEMTEAWTPSLALAENAVAGVAYAIRCTITGDPQSAVWTARQAIEALDV